MSEQIEGRQPVREALRAGRPISKIMIAEGVRPSALIEEILSLARAAGVRIQRVARAELDRRALGRAHQGVVAEAAAVRSRPWDRAVESARAAGRVPLLLALDGVEDPQNLGALLRSAEVFGVDAVILPRRRSAPLGATAAKASAGAIEHLWIDQVPNLERALAVCREQGMWVVALDAGGDQDLGDCTLLEEPVVVVVGAEGAGVSRLILSRADAVVGIPTTGKVASLNASAAGAICLWEVNRRRARAGHRG